MELFTIPTLLTRETLLILNREYGNLVLCDGGIMKYPKVIKNYYFDLQNQVAFINRTWNTKMQKMIKKGMPEIRIAWYYNYAIQRGKYRVYLKYRNDIFKILRMGIDRKILGYLIDIFNSFSNIELIPYNNEV